MKCSIALCSMIAVGRVRPVDSDGRRDQWEPVGGDAIRGVSETRALNVWNPGGRVLEPGSGRPGFFFFAQSDLSTNRYEKPHLTQAGTISSRFAEVGSSILVMQSRIDRIGALAAAAIRLHPCCCRHHLAGHFKCADVCGFVGRFGAACAGRRPSPATLTMCFPHVG